MPALISLDNTFEPLTLPLYVFPGIFCHINLLTLYWFRKSLSDAVRKSHNYL